MRIVNAAQNVTVMTHQMIRESNTDSAHALIKTTDQLHNAVHHEVLIPSGLEAQMLKTLGHFAQESTRGDDLSHAHVVQMLAGISQPTEIDPDEEQ